MLNIFWGDRLKNEEVRRMVNETSTLAQAARFSRLNFAFHILRHDSLLKEIPDDWGTLDLDKLPKRTWMYEVLKDISLVRESSGRNDHQLSADRNAQRVACWNSIRRSGNMGRLQCEICLKPFVTPGWLKRHRRLKHGLPDA
jgi:hypothetical protein